MPCDRDQHWMRRAIDLASLGIYSTTPNPRVGCVIVSAQNDKLGEGFHLQAGGPHAEVNAIADAGEGTTGSTVYVTLEPCNHQGRTGACTEALIAAKVARVVFGMTDPNPLVAGRGIARLREAGIAVDGPVLEADCEALNPGFIKRMRFGRPWVRCKMAASLDGRTAMANGESKWITGPSARADVQHWRARSCAVVTGVETVLADDPAMTVRLDGSSRQPLRVVVDSMLRTPSDAKILLQHGRVAIATCAFKRQGFAAPVEIWGMPSRAGRVDLAALLRRLAEQECNEVMIEAGPRLAGAFLTANLVDELILYWAPKLMGSQARPLFDIPLTHLAESIPLSICAIDPVGDDWRVRAEVIAQELNACLPE